MTSPNRELVIFLPSRQAEPSQLHNIAEEIVPNRLIEELRKKVHNNPES
jgi:hypothetical protein